MIIFYIIGYYNSFFPFRGEFFWFYEVQRVDIFLKMAEN